MAAVAIQPAFSGYRCAVAATRRPTGRSSPLREFTGPPPTMIRMKSARDARSAAVVINAGSRRGAAHELAVDAMRKAGVPISSVHHVLSGGRAGRDA